MNFEKIGYERVSFHIYGYVRSLSHLHFRSSCNENFLTTVYPQFLASWLETYDSLDLLSKSNKGN